MSEQDSVQVYPFFFFTLGAGLSPAQGSVKPTARFTFNKVISLYLNSAGV